MVIIESSLAGSPARSLDISDRTVASGASVLFPCDSDGADGVVLSMAFLQPRLEERHGEHNTVGTVAVAWEQHTRAGSHSSITDVEGSCGRSGQRTLDDHHRVPAGKRGPGAYPSCASARLRIGRHHHDAGERWGACHIGAWPDLL